jgi:hypothetical protein
MQIKYELMSHSKLLNYIHQLMVKDEALEHYLADPITEAEEKYGLTKAERTVLRRTITHLSNNSINGYSLHRDFTSYRRSLRLLQNVLNTTGLKMGMDVPNGENSKAVDTENTAIQRGSLVIYLPDFESLLPFFDDGTCDLTGKIDYSTVGDNWPAYAASITIPNVPLLVGIDDSVRGLMANADIRANVQGYLQLPHLNFSAPLKSWSYESQVVNGNTVVKSIALQIENRNPKTGEILPSLPLLGGYSLNIIADLSDSSYNVDDPNNRYAFWFFSKNGRANPKLSNYGGPSETFTDVFVDSGDVIYWQFIAPDRVYGFELCASGEKNKYAQKLRAAQ